jgi:hypothetical protein
MPFPFPTLFAPAGSNAGPPFVASETPAGVTAVAGDDTTAPAEPNPHPVLPFCVDAPVPEQIPVGFAQQPLPQSALLRHWPPINCPPLALPMFFAPAGSKGGTAYATRATGGIVSTWPS